jgi:hypothetical protein
MGGLNGEDLAQLTIPFYQVNISMTISSVKPDNYGKSV